MSVPPMPHDDADEATGALIRWAVDHCPVLDTVRRAVPIELTIG